MKTFRSLKRISILTLALAMLLGGTLTAIAESATTGPQAIRYTVTALPEPTVGGTVDGAGYFYAGERAVLKAIPYLGYRFTGWYDINLDQVSQNATLDITVYEDVTFTARFIRDYDTPSPQLPTPPVTTPDQQLPIYPGQRPPQGTIAVIIGGKYVQYDVPPMTDNGRTLVPLRATFEALGAYVEWDPDTQTVIGKRGNTTVELVIGRSYATVNGTRVNLDVPGRTVQGRTMVPLRFISESLGGVVDWDPDTLTVTITQPATIY